ncbi:MAG: PAS domain-containing protein [bacterium]
MARFIRDKNFPRPEGERFSVSELIRLYYQHSVDGVPVIDAIGRLVGVLPKSAVVRTTSYASNLKQSITQIIKDNLLPIDGVDKDKVMSAILGGKEIAEIPVINEEGRFVELWNRRDLMDAIENNSSIAIDGLEVVVNSIGRGIMVVDKDERIIYVNCRFTELTGLERGDVVGEKLNVAIHDTQLSQVIKTQEEVFEIRIGTENRPVIYDGTPMIVNGNLIGAVFVVDEIEKIKKIASQLIQIDSIPLKDGGKKEETE